MGNTMAAEGTMQANELYDNELTSTLYGLLECFRDSHNESGRFDSVDTIPQSPQGEIVRQGEVGTLNAECGNLHSEAHLNPHARPPPSVLETQESAVHHWTSASSNSEGQETAIPQSTFVAGSLYHSDGYTTSASHNEFTTCASTQEPAIPNAGFVPPTNSSLRPQQTMGVIIFHRDGIPLGTPLSQNITDADRSQNRPQNVSVARSSPSKPRHYHPYVKQKRTAFPESPKTPEVRCDQQKTASAPTNTAGPRPSKIAKLYSNEHQQALDAIEAIFQAPRNTQSVEMPQGISYEGTSEPSSHSSPGRWDLAESCLMTLDEATLQEKLSSIGEIESKCRKVRAFLKNLHHSQML